MWPPTRRRPGGSPTRRLGLAIACATAAGLAGAWPLAAGPSTSGPQAGASLQLVASRLLEASAPGALAAVRTPGGARRAAAGVAQIRPPVPMRATDRYRIASVTKPFVAAVVLQLEREGKLRIADSVEQWLPGLVPNGHAITLRMLLGHTSGLVDYGDDDAWVRARIAAPARTWTPRQLIAVATRHAPPFSPGTDWSYSNTNYVLLGLVVEAATSSTLGRELRTRIFRPLHLGATSYPLGTAMRGRTAHGYLGAAPGLPIPAGRLVDVTTRVSPSSWGSGQIVSNADDVTRFFAALLGEDVLPAAELAKMKNAVRGSGPVPFTVPYGLGLDIRQTPCGIAYGHEGDMPGYRNAVWATADGRRVAAVMANVQSRRPTWIAIRRAADAAFCSG